MARKLKLTNAEITRQYLEKSLEKGRWLEVRELRKGALSCSLSYIYNYLGGLATLKTRARLFDPKGAKELDMKSLVREDEGWAMNVAKIYREESLKVGHWLTQKEITQSERLPNYNKLLKRSSIGGIKNLRKLATSEEAGGLMPEEFQDKAHFYGQRFYDLPKAMKLYYQESKKRGCWLNVAQIRYNPRLPAIGYYYRNEKYIFDLPEVAEEKFGPLFEEGKEWDGRQNATAEEEAVALNYLRRSQEAGKWLSVHNIDAKVLGRFGGIERLKMHLYAKYEAEANLVAPKANNL